MRIISLRDYLEQAASVSFRLMWPCVSADPTSKVRVDMSHVTLAIGRHCGDVMPLRVVIQRGGEHTLTVAVTRCSDLQ